MANTTKSSLAPSLRFPYGNGYIDQITGVTFIGYHPERYPEQWQTYLEGLEHSYTDRGIDGILERDRLERGEGINLFLLGYTENGDCVAGIRFHGPLANADDTSLITEMASSSKIEEIRDTVDQACEQGAIEVKGLWSLGKKKAGASLLVTMTRTILVAQEWLGSENAFATVAERMAPLGDISGAIIIGEPVVFPDDRYLTILAWYRRSYSPLNCTQEYAQALESDLQQLESGQITQPPASK